MTIQTTQINMEEIRNRVKDALVNLGTITKDQRPFLTEESVLLNVCGDSLEVLEAIMVLETEFDINIDSDFRSIVTMNDLYEYIYSELTR